MIAHRFVDCKHNFFKAAKKTFVFFNFLLTTGAFSAKIPIAVQAVHGGIAQLARAFGSYPKCPRFESRCRYQNIGAASISTAPFIWPVGQVVKTPPFHGGNMGSSPVRVTRTNQSAFGGLICFISSPRNPKQSRTDNTAASVYRLRRVFIISRYRSPRTPGRSPARFSAFSLFPRANRDPRALLYARSCPRRDIFERPR